MYFLHHTFSDLRLTFIEFDRLKELCAFHNRKFGNFTNVLTAQTHSQYFRLKASSLTHITRRLTHIRFVLIAAVITISFTMATVNEWNYAFKACCVVLSTVAALVLHLNFILIAINNRITCFNRDLLPRRIERE